MREMGRHFIAAKWARRKLNRVGLDTSAFVQVSKKLIKPSSRSFYSKKVINIIIGSQASSSDIQDSEFMLSAEACQLLMRRLLISDEKPIVYFLVCLNYASILGNFASESGDRKANTPHSCASMMIQRRHDHFDCILGITNEFKIELNSVQVPPKQKLQKIFTFYAARLFCQSSSPIHGICRC